MNQRLWPPERAGHVPKKRGVAGDGTTLRQHAERLANRSHQTCPDTPQDWSSLSSPLDGAPGSATKALKNKKFRLHCGLQVTILPTARLASIGQGVLRASAKPFLLRLIKGKNARAPVDGLRWDTRESSRANSRTPDSA